MRRRGLRQALHGPVITAQAREVSPSRGGPARLPRPRARPAAPARPRRVPRQAGHAALHQGQAGRAAPAAAVRGAGGEGCCDAVIALADFS